MHKLVGLWSFKNKLFALKNLNFSKQNLSESRYPLYQLLFLGHFDKLRINLKPFYTTDQEVIFCDGIFPWMKESEQRKLHLASFMLAVQKCIPQPTRHKKTDMCTYRTKSIEYLNWNISRLKFQSFIAFFLSANDWMVFLIH